MGDQAGLQSRGTDQDGDRGQRDRAQYRDSWWRRRRGDSNGGRERPPRAAPFVRGPGPRHSGCRAGAEGWLHYRRRAGPGAGRGQTAGQRAADRFDPGKRHPDYDDAMEVIIEQAQSLHRAKESGDVGEARRAAVSRAEALGFDETVCGKVALVVTEAGTNLIKHAGGGQIILGTATRPAGTALEILTVDRGPGISDLGRGLRDGFSTAGSPGTGLGSIRRMSSFFDLYSSPAGTVLVSRIFREERRKPKVVKWHLGAVSLPLQGESVSGDAWGYALNGERALLVIVDGLGHGQLAYEAAQGTLKTLR